MINERDNNDNLNEDESVAQATEERSVHSWEQSAAQVARELASLGEAPLDGDEAAFAMSGATASDVDVLNVRALVDLSTAADPEPLQPLASHRVWKRIAARGGTALAEPVDASADASATGQVRPNSGVWRALIAGAAVAAGVLLVPRLYAPSKPVARTQASDGELGRLARAGLESLPGATDGERARNLAKGYAARLGAAQGEGELH